ncbi:uroporphyrinogen-III C-methyltransferase [Paralcaligenes ureilyticus]|uniref:uroporphyrinogen-III C-methyltransferase n=1 Tax=Paralcaligenes ureilyticus TaxID=627131 RepID=A0A4R3LU04_9BURK|nr:uroporphyrinogen-III C-methyltransferase [Paralcaligenes ureilyticus]TCT04070.1 uroporphyrin-III C-methyltransferase [Paralcaligenes ureilyticus]
MNTSTRTERPPSSGKVWLVGAGPGDAELLTLKAARVLAQCTVWLVDDLVGRDILDLAQPGTKIIEVGKRGGCASTPQNFILRLMARYAREGHAVARVKGGDPFIFGRAGEEMTWLKERRIDVEGISGITAGLAVASALGLPLTHREVSRGVTLVTAHTVDDSRPDWSSLARSGLTIVCYMGMSQPDMLQAELLAAGFPATLPVAIAAQVSCAAQRHAVTTLTHLAATVQARHMTSPAVIILGEVVRHAQALPQQDADGVDSLAMAI